MTFEQLQAHLEKNFGISKLADIAREMNVSPQVVSNWKARNQVPYKYVKQLREKIITSHRPINEVSSFSQIVNDQDTENESFIETILNFLLIFQNNIILIASTTSIITIVTIVYVLFIAEPVFKSTATIIPMPEKKSDLKGLAAQFGIGGQSEQTDFAAAELYPYIINSRTLHDSLLVRRFTTKKYGQNKLLFSILMNADGKSNADRATNKYIANDILDDMINVSQVYKSPVIDLTTYGFEAKFAKDLADAVIDELDKLQKRFRLASITEKRLFIEQRTKDILSDLTKGEEDLRSFREKNRKIMSSPSLMLEQQRLVREVEVQMAVYISIKQELEFVQIEEVENSSKMVILDKPDIPISRVSPRRTKTVLISIFFGAILGCALVLLNDWIKKNWDIRIKPILKSA